LSKINYNFRTEGFLYNLVLLKKKIKFFFDFGTKFKIFKYNKIDIKNIELLSCFSYSKLKLNSNNFSNIYFFLFKDIFFNSYFEDYSQIYLNNFINYNFF
jgi:hypothetical protein